MDYQLYFKSRQGEMIGLLKELVQRESPTADKRAVDSCSVFLADKFKALGAKITRLPQRKFGDFYLLEYPGRNDRIKRERILILTHIDTVWPVGQLDKMPFYLQGGKIFGPGVLDMKGGLVLAYSALKALRDMNRTPDKRITVFINSAEETGCSEAQEVIRTQARKSEIVLCLEPALPGGALKTQRKGRLVIRLESFGRSAHAGQPEKGINAIEELAAQIKSLAALRSKDVTMNIGLIGGGEKANIVADKAWAVLDFRFWTAAQKTKILAAARTLKPIFREARSKATIESLTPPLERTPASIRLLAAARTIAERLGITLETGKTGGGSDGSIAAALGKATLDGLGPDGDGIHALDEHLLLASLVQRAALLTELLLRL